MKLTDNAIRLVSIIFSTISATIFAKVYVDKKIEEDITIEEAINIKRGIHLLSGLYGVVIGILTLIYIEKRK